MSTKDLLKKHEFAIECAMKYYVKNEPTGLLDYEFDALERAALADGIDIREIALSKLKGNRIKNRYIEKVPKVYAEGSMFSAIAEFHKEYGYALNIYVEPKYDGSSIAVYYENGMPYQVVTCGGSNKDSEDGGIDQTDKLLKYFPSMDPSIKAIQCEVLVDMNHCDKPRQLANGILNSKNKYTTEEIDSMIRIRAFRYFSDEPKDFLHTMRSMNGTVNTYGEYMFSPGHVVPVYELLGKGADVVNREYIDTPTGSFLIDGYVFYGPDGSLIKAIKFKNSGGQESVEVSHIQWNDLSDSKDGFSANVILKTPIEIRGSKVYKPSSNGVNNLLSKGISPGATVSVTLRGSTIPCVDQVFTEGNGDYNWPVCQCGTQLGPNDIYGNNLKCPNLMCSSRINRMRAYLNSGRFSWNNVSSLDGFFILDRFSFSKKVKYPEDFMYELHSVISKNLGPEGLKGLISSLGLTKLQAKNLELIVGPAYQVLHEYVNYSNLNKIS